MAGLREKQKHQRRQRIMDAAQSLIRRTGGTQFTMKELAEEAEVSLATSYNLLNSKEGVLSGVLSRQIRKTVEKALVTESQDPICFVEAAIAGAVDSLLDDTPLMRPLYKYLFGVVGPEHRRSHIELSLNFWSKLVEAVCPSESISDNEYEEIDKCALTYMMLSQFVGFLELWIYEDIDDATFKTLSVYAGLLVFVPFLSGSNKKNILAKLDATRTDLKNQSSHVFSLVKNMPATRAG